MVVILFSLQISLNDLAMYSSIIPENIILVPRASCLQWSLNRLFLLWLKHIFLGVDQILLQEDLAAGKMVMVVLEVSVGQDSLFPEE